MHDITILKQFTDWVMRPSSDYDVVRTDDRHIQLRTSFALGEVNIYDLEIVEFRITVKGEEDPKFYLHFLLNDLNHAKELFAEMLTVLQTFCEEKKIKVLLSCSCGVTTSYFKDKLNEAADTLYQNYEFNAVDQSALFEHSFDYDVILLAPQIAYLYPKVKEILADKIVLKLPAAVFGTYDVLKALKYVDDALKKVKEKKSHTSEKMAVCTTHYKILAISVQASSEPVRIACRIYDHGVVTLDETVIKQLLRPTDVTDIMDTVLARESDIQIVGVSIPGIISGEEESNASNLFEDKDKIRQLGTKYGIPVLCENNVNCAAVGYYSSLDENADIMFHYQNKNRNVAGEGFVINDRLITGYRHTAGEIRFFADHMKFPKNPNDMMSDIDGAAEVVAKYLLMNICTISPQKIAVCSEMTPDMDLVREKLRRFIPEEYIPPLVPISDMKEYMLSGQMHLCSEYMDEKNQDIR